MIKLLDILNEGVVMFDDEDEIHRMGYYTEHGDEGVGAFHPKTWNRDGHLLKLDAYDEKLVSKLRLKNGERVFRYETDTTKAGSMKPLVKVNIDRGLVYFLTPESSDSGEYIEFETRGVPVRYMRFRKSKI